MSPAEIEKALDDIATHIGHLRRSSVALYGGGMISQGDHARIMLKIFKREDRLIKAVDPSRTRSAAA